MSKLPFMPFFIGDYLADTPSFSAEEHGAYIMLIFAMWTAGGRLPNDPGRLAKIACVSRGRWPAIARTVMPLFADDGETISHKRVSRELADARARSERKAAAGRKGGRPKKTNGKAPDPKPGKRDLPPSDQRPVQDVTQGGQTSVKSLKSPKTEKAELFHSRAGATPHLQPHVEPRAAGVSQSPDAALRFDSANQPDFDSPSGDSDISKLKPHTSAAALPVERLAAAGSAVVEPDGQPPPPKPFERNRAERERLDAKIADTGLRIVTPGGRPVRDGRARAPVTAEKLARVAVSKALLRLNRDAYVRLAAVPDHPAWTAAIDAEKAAPGSGVGVFIAAFATGPPAALIERDDNHQDEDEDDDVDDDDGEDP